MAQRGEVSPLPRLAAADERLALSVLRRTQRKRGKDRRCSSCGVLFPQDEVHPEVDEEGRRIGWTCEGCE